jgi:hypothetical protein
VPKQPQDPSYEEWAAQRTAEQMHKAGWRLAHLLYSLWQEGLFKP